MSQKNNINVKKARKNLNERVFQLFYLKDKLLLKRCVNFKKIENKLIEK